MKLVKIFLRNSTTSKRLSSDALLSFERVRAEKIDLDGFVDELHRPHDAVKPGADPGGERLERSLVLKPAKSYFIHHNFLYNSETAFER